MGGSEPASRRRTFQLSTSLSLAATTEPADPAPTTMKSNILLLLQSSPMLDGYVQGGDSIHPDKITVLIRSVNASPASPV
uniref:Uncharacterized protein n=1 Tax=Panstrongylus lignarius TaxID=156445 RepID=A0A224XWK5_9HEMI